MKNFISLLLFLVIVGGSQNLFGQSKKNNSTQDQTCYGVSFVGAIRMNVLYVGIKNNITVNICGIPSDEYKIRTDNGIISRRPDNLYDIIPEKEGFCNIYVSYGTQSETGYNFRCKRLPKPSVYILGKENSKIDNTVNNVKQSDLLKMTKVSFHVDDFDYAINYELSDSYTLTRISDTNIKTRVQNQESVFNSEALALLESASINDIFILSDMIVKCPENGSIYNIANFTFQVVE